MLRHLENVIWSIFDRLTNYTPKEYKDPAFEFSEEDLIDVIREYITNNKGDAIGYHKLNVTFLENSNDEVHVRARAEVDDK